MRVTTSWDDGHPSDRRVADLLARHGLAGTFYVPTRNSEGRPVMTEAEVRALATGFEIGGHSVDHVVLTRLEPDELARQIGQNRAWLADALGRAPEGFCYVQGRYNAAVKRSVAEAGYRYARTTRNLTSDPGRDRFELSTTVQFYPHARTVYLRNFARRPALSRLPSLAVLLKGDGLERRVESLTSLCSEEDDCFHLWGHSWEIDDLGLWEALDRTLARIAATRPRSVTNGEVAGAIGSARPAPAAPRDSAR